MKTNSTSLHRTRGGSVRPVVRLRDAEVSQQECDGFAGLELPRSAWIVSVSRLICCWVVAWAISCLATSPDSRCCTVHPTL